VHASAAQRTTYARNCTHFIGRFGSAIPTLFVTPPEASLFRLYCTVFNVNVSGNGTLARVLIQDQYLDGDNV
jgi:hypothetical protein